MIKKRYKFRMSETNWIEFSDFSCFKDVYYTDDNSKGKIIPVTRAFDNKTYHLLVPLDMIEDIKDE